MIITIDGPAGTGKSTVAQEVAKRLSFDFLDTGAMYRALGLAMIRRAANLGDARELAFIARHAKIEFDWAKRPPGVLLNGEAVGHLLRGSEATNAASFVATVPAIREQLVSQQKQIGLERPNLVTEGRDQGSVVFPDAALKFYVHATVEERACWRAVELRKRGEIVDMAALQAEIAERDERDEGREVGPLKVPEGAEKLDTTHMTQEQVVEYIVGKGRKKIMNDEL